MDYCFKTDRFNVSKEETQNTSQYMFGKELAEFIKEELLKIKEMDSKTPKYKNLVVTDENGYWSVDIRDNFFKKEVNISTAFYQTEMTDEGIPKDLWDIIWCVEPIIYFNLLDPKSYLKTLFGKKYHEERNELCMDIEKIIKEQKFKEVRVLE